jgi:hypothetical protein
MILGVSLRLTLVRGSWMDPALPPKPVFGKTDIARWDVLIAPNQRFPHFVGSGEGITPEVYRNIMRNEQTVVFFGRILYLPAFRLRGEPRTTGFCHILRTNKDSGKHIWNENGGNDNYRYYT